MQDPQQPRSSNEHRGAGERTAEAAPPPLSPTERQQLSGNVGGTASGSDTGGSIADPNDPQNRIAHEQPSTEATGQR